MTRIDRFRHLFSFLSIFVLVFRHRLLCRSLQSTLFHQFAVLHVRGLYILIGHE